MHNGGLFPVRDVRLRYGRLFENAKFTLPLNCAVEIIGLRSG